jgi:FkbM family methyltransferase
MEILDRWLSKAEQITSFFVHTQTPAALTLDSLKLKRDPFVAVSKGGVKLRLDPLAGESFTFFENFVRQDYLRNGIALKAGDTVVDIGANIGAFALNAASIVGPTGRVIAIEPAGRTFARLEENVRLNNSGNIICVRAAVDHEPGTLTLRLHFKSAFSSAHNVNANSDGAVEIVPCHTLAQIFAEYRIQHVDLLKVDCEGSEYGIFESLPQELAARIHQIAMEVHPVEGMTFDRMRHSLEKLGFEVLHFPGYPWLAFNNRAGDGKEHFFEHSGSEK